MEVRLGLAQQPGEVQAKWLSEAHAIVPTPRNISLYLATHLQQVSDTKT